MAIKVIQRFNAIFDEFGNAEVDIPQSSFSLSLRFYTNDPPESMPAICVIALVYEGTPATTYKRMFSLWPEDLALPETFKKYIGTTTYGPKKKLVNVIEV